MLDIARELSRKPEPTNVVQEHPLRLSEEAESPEALRERLAAKSVGEQIEQAPGKSERQHEEVLQTSRVASELAERAAAERTDAMPPREQGRVQGHGEQTINRTIQKER
ncbi:hypothetical protein ACSFCW_26975 [Yokenella regensburgei]|uniref:hypothetical protein n=1 Tax=Yokenella regensburgei TaxID=158877 RepID=UPI003ED9ED2A